ncbi:MAG: hypothetical protein AAGL89_12860 [Pseudomonadota bacterium]
MTDTPEMQFAYVATAKALTAIQGRIRHSDCLELATLTLRLELPAAARAAASQFLDTVNHSPEAAGCALRDFVVAMLPKEDPAPTSVATRNPVPQPNEQEATASDHQLAPEPGKSEPIEYAWQSRADLQ